MQRLRPHMNQVPTCQNVEQKFRCPDLEAACAAAMSAGAIAAETIQQRDVYFNARRGRLKLRSVSSDNGGRWHELIAYERADAMGERLCNYHVVPVKRSCEIEAALNAVLGARAIVGKRRRLLMDGPLRIHLDEVEALGSFVEFEYVLSPGEDEAVGRARIARWRELLRLNDPVPVSYIDLSDAGRTATTVSP